MEYDKGFVEYLVSTSSPGQECVCVYVYVCLYVLVYWYALVCVFVCRPMGAFTWTVYSPFNSGLTLIPLVNS